MLELYHYEPGANSAKPMICLKEKGLDFVSHYIDLHAFEQHSPEYVAINPNGQVPALIHDGKIITESTVINEYLDDVFPEVPLRPADAYERAQMRIWSKFVDEYYCPALSLIGWHHMIEGIVKEQCTSMGCYFFFHEGDKILRVDLQDIAMNAPRRQGRPARVEGRMVVYGDGYQLWASAVEFK